MNPPFHKRRFRSFVSSAYAGGTVVEQLEQPSNMIFHTIKQLNPEHEEPPADKKSHTVLLSNPQEGVLIMGFEDLNRETAECDHDFNDAVIAIKVSPFSAIDRSQIQSLKNVVADSDGDRLTDDLDAFPLDPKRAARRFYPNDASFGYLSFEDNWPKKCDFDMNDLAILSGSRNAECPK